VKRTIQSAERELEAIAPGLNPVAFRQVQSEVDAAKTEATRFATAVAGDLASTVDVAREDTLMDLCEVRDALAALKKEGESGRLTARAYAAKLDVLRSRQRTAENTISRLAESAENLATIEEDPVAYADHFYDGTPLLKPDFTF